MRRGSFVYSVGAATLLATAATICLAVAMTSPASAVPSTSANISSHADKTPPPLLTPAPQATRTSPQATRPSPQATRPSPQATRPSLPATGRPAPKPSASSTPGATDSPTPSVSPITDPAWRGPVLVSFQAVDDSGCCFFLTAGYAGGATVGEYWAPGCGAVITDGAPPELSCDRDVWVSPDGTDRSPYDAPSGLESVFIQFARLPGSLPGTWCAGERSVSSPNPSEIPAAGCALDLPCVMAVTNTPQEGRTVVCGESVGFNPDFRPPARPPLLTSKTSPIIVLGEKITKPRPTSAPSPRPTVGASAAPKAVANDARGTPGPSRSVWLLVALALTWAGLLATGIWLGHQHPRRGPPPRFSRASGT